MLILHQELTFNNLYQSKVKIFKATTGLSNTTVKNKVA
jgi:hypothetical protein